MPDPNALMTEDTQETERTDIIEQDTAREADAVSPSPLRGTDPETEDTEAAAPAPKKKRRKQQAVSEHINMPPLSGPVLRRSIWREWRGSILMFCFASVYTELCLHLCVYHSVDGRIVYPILFGLVGGMLCSLVSSCLPKIPGRVLAVTLVLLQVLYAEVQLVYHAIFGNFMPISQVSMGGGVVTNFGGQILYGIGQNILWILLLLVPLALMILTLALRKAPRHRLRWKQNLTTVGLSLLVLCVTVGIMRTGKGEAFSVYEIFNNVNTSTDISYKNVGILATTEQELRFMMFGDEAEDTKIVRVGLEAIESL